MKLSIMKILIYTFATSVLPLSIAVNGAEASAQACSEENKGTIKAYAYKCFVPNWNFGIPTFKSYEHDGHRDLVKHASIALLDINGGFNVLYYRHISPNENNQNTPNDGSFVIGYLKFYAKALYCHVLKNGFNETSRTLPGEYIHVLSDISNNGQGKCAGVDTTPINLIVAGTPENRQGPCLSYLANLSQNLHPDAHDCLASDKRRLDEYVSIALRTDTRPAIISAIQIEGRNELRNSAHIDGLRNANDGTFITAYLKCYAPQYKKLVEEQSADKINRLLPGWVHFPRFEQLTIPNENIINPDPVLALISTGRNGECSKFLGDLSNTINNDVGQNAPQSSPIQRTRTDNIDDPAGWRHAASKFTRQMSNESINSAFNASKNSCIQSGVVKQNVEWCFRDRRSISDNTPWVASIQLDGAEQMTSAMDEQNPAKFLVGYAKCQIHQVRCLEQPRVIQASAAVLGYPEVGAAINQILRLVSCRGHQDSGPARILEDPQCLPYLAGMAMVTRDRW